MCVFQNQPILNHRSSQTQGHRIGLYIRSATSGNSGALNASLKLQEDRLRQVIAGSHLGWVAGIYMDPHHSGMRLDRPAIMRLLSDVNARKINLVMVTDLARLSRSISNANEVLNYLKSHGCSFQSLEADSFLMSAEKGGQHE